MNDSRKNPDRPDRRDFLRTTLCTGCAMAASACSAGAEEPTEIQRGIGVSNREALHYEKQDGKKIVCKLCPKECRVANLERGYCGVRENLEGVYKTLVYGRPCSLQVDPIEKKPLYHYRPGTKAFSLSTVGCNVECVFCQNWNTSQFRPEQIPSYDLDPGTTAYVAGSANAPTIAYTYTEPVIYYEYMRDTAAEAKKLGIGSVMISNGYIQEKPMRELAPLLTGMKIDFKGFSESFYRDYCGGEMKPVLDTIELVHGLGLWLELVILIIPTLNDDEQSVHDMCAWVHEKVGPDVPMHFSRYHPTYKLTNIPPTPVSTVERCREIAIEEKIRYAYVGNVQGHPGEHTYCPGCDTKLIQRVGYTTKFSDWKDGKCGTCEHAIPGVWKDPLQSTS